MTKSLRADIDILMELVECKIDGICDDEHLEIEYDITKIIEDDDKCEFLNSDFISLIFMMLFNKSKNAVYTDLTNFTFEFLFLNKKFSGVKIDCQFIKSYISSFLYNSKLKTISNIKFIKIF